MLRSSSSPVMRWLDGWLWDVRYSWRLLRKTPLLSASIVATLTLGIGLDVGAFTLLDGALFQPRVEHDPDSFVQIATRSSTPTDAGVSLTSLADYRAMLAESRTLSDLAAWTPVHASLARSATDEASRDLVPLLVTCNFFSVYRSETLLGRLFRADECAESAPVPVVIIAEDLWRTRLGADPDIVGSAIALNRQLFTVVGIMRSGDASQLRSGVWLPYTLAARFHGGRDLVREPETPWLMALAGRLRPGVSREAVRAELSTIVSRRDGLFPGRRTAVRASNGSLMASDEARALAFWVAPLIFTALMLVLLLVCGNVAMLLLSRASARQREIAVRLSLGADRGRLLRMLLTESLLLAMLAGPPAAWLAVKAPVLRRAFLPSMPVYSYKVDGFVLAYLIGVTVVAGLLGGLAPAIESLKPSVSESLAGRETFLGTRTRWSTRNILIVVQIAMSLALLIGAGLFVTAEVRLLASDPGAVAERILIATPRIGVPPYTIDSAAAFERALAERIGAIPGVRAVAVASAPPIGSNDERGAVSRWAITASRVRSEIALNVVSPQYFDVLNLPIVRGALFAEVAPVGGVTPAVIAEGLARRLMPDRDPIGDMLELSDGRRVEVVGVAAGLRTSLSTGPDLTVYVPRSARLQGDVMMVRFDGDAARIAIAVRAAMAALNPDSVSEPRTMASLQRDLAQKFSSVVSLVSFVAFVALGLAMIGIYGLISFATGRRTREMGIRLALGATPRDIVSMVLVSGIRPVAVGVAGGITLSLLASQALTQIFRNAPVRLSVRDPVVYAGVSALLVGAAVAAMLGPARRAAAADPVHALRED